MVDKIKLDGVDDELRVLSYESLVPASDGNTLIILNASILVFFVTILYNILLGMHRSIKNQGASGQTCCC